MRVVVLILLCAVACKKANDPTCEQVGEAYAALVDKQIAKEYGGPDLERARQRAPEVVAQLVKVCQQKSWNPGVRRCLVAAKNAADLEHCQHPGEPAQSAPDAGSEPNGN